MNPRYSLPREIRVRRMRDWRLYDQRGGRWTDFYQGDGAAFLGHRPDGVARTVAAEIDRGLWSIVPTAWIGRFERALAALAGSAGIRRFLPVASGSPDHAAPGSLSGGPPTAGSEAESPRRWYPLANARPSDGGDGRETAELVLPFPQPIAASPGSLLPPPEDLPVAVLSGFTRAAWALRDYVEGPEASRRLDLAASLPTPPGYRRCGVYFFSDSPGDSDDELYGRRIEVAWKHAIVLPPHPGIPCCVPGELGRVELRSWEALCRDWPQ